ncbi:unnamed protein product [Discosporangium mesarthrocarpum]
MDPKSEWAHGDFREASIELVLINGDGKVENPWATGRKTSSENNTATEQLSNSLGGGGRASKGRRIVCQGDNMEVLLVVKFPGGLDNEELTRRWRRFGQQLNVEVEVTAEGVGSTSASRATEDPSLWRDYEGRVTEHDRSVLMRTNQTLHLAPEQGVGENGLGACLSYRLEAEVGVALK